MTSTTDSFYLKKQRSLSRSLARPTHLRQAASPAKRMALHASPAKTPSSSPLPAALKRRCPMPPSFPLRVDYQEKFSAAGKTLGGFLKREGRPTENHILDKPPHRQAAASPLSRGLLQRRTDFDLRLVLRWDQCPRRDGYYRLSARPAPLRYPLPQSARRCARRHDR